VGSRNRFGKDRGSSWEEKKHRPGGEITKVPQGTRPGDRMSAPGAKQWTIEKKKHRRRRSCRKTQIGLRAQNCLQKGKIAKSDQGSHGGKILEKDDQTAVGVPCTTKCGRGRVKQIGRREVVGWFLPKLYRGGRILAKGEKCPGAAKSLELSPRRSGRIQHPLGREKNFHHRNDAERKRNSPVKHWKRGR